MTLTVKQCRRFMNLLIMLLLYCADELGMDWFRELDEPEMEDLFAVYARIWGPDGRRDLVGQFVQANPGRLKWADLKEVGGWDKGLFGRFQVMREGANVFYIAGEHAFAVRGQIEEADSEEGFELTCVESLILPFDGVLTNGMFVRDLSRSSEALSEDARRELLAQCKRDGHLVRGARQFVRPAAVVREVLDKVAPVGPDGLGEPVPRELHAGALAGLSWEERSKVVDDAQATVLPELKTLAVEEIERCVVRGKPARTYAELLSRFTKDYLLKLADHFDADFTRKMNKQRLVEAILEVMPIDTESLLGPAIMEGVDELELVRKVLEAGGRIDVDRDDPEGCGRLPIRSYPAVSIYRTEGGYAAAMVDEAIEVLSSADFDGLAKRAADCDRACRYATLVSDFRGAVPLSDVLVDCMKELDIMESPFLLVYALRQRDDRAECCEIVEMDGESYLVSPFLAALCDPDDFVDEAHTIMDRLLEAHYEREARPMAKVFRDGDYGSLWEYLFDQSSFRAIAAYFDAHVPEGESDLLFAETVLDPICTYICGIAPDRFERDFMFELMERSGLTVPDEDVPKVEAMLDDLVATMPNWYENGWPIKGRRLRLV